MKRSPRRKPRAADGQAQAIAAASDSARRKAAEELEPQFSSVWRRQAERHANRQPANWKNSSSGVLPKQPNGLRRKRRPNASSCRRNWINGASSQKRNGSWRRLHPSRKSFRDFCISPILSPVGLAVYVAKVDGLALWKSRGKASFPAIISRDTTDPEAYFRTINVRGKAVAAVCAAPPFSRETLDFLTASLERASKRLD